MIDCFACVHLELKYLFLLRYCVFIKLFIISMWQQLHDASQKQLFYTCPSGGHKIWMPVYTGIIAMKKIKAYL